MSTAQEWKSQGNDSFKTQDYTKAIECYSKAIEMDPTDHSFYSNRSGAYFNLGEFEKALEDAELCIKTNQSFVKGYSRKGLALEKLKKYEEAQSAYEEGLKIDESSKDLLSGKERCQSQQGGGGGGGGGGGEGGEGFDINSLLQNPMIQDLIKKNPQMAQQLLSNPEMLKNPQMMQMMMNMFAQQQQGSPQQPQQPPQQQGQFNPGFQQPPFEQTQEPTNPFAQQSEPLKKLSEFQELKKDADSKYLKKDFDGAIEIYQKCQELEPNNLIVRTNEATCYLEKKEYEKSIEILVKAEKVYQETDFEKRSFENYAKVLEKKGRVNQLSGNLDEAIVQYEKSLLENSVGKVKAALRQVKRLKKKNDEEEYISPELSEEHRQKGNEFYKAQQYPEAIKEYEEAQKRNPKDPKVYNNLCAGFIKLMRFEDAKKFAEKVLELEPENLKAKLKLASIHFFSKEYHKAIDIYQEILKGDPQNLDAQKGLRDTQIKIQSGMHGGNDEERVQRAMQDPEIQSIMMDPMVRIALEQMQANPQKSMEYMQDPSLGPKIQRLIQAGVLKVA